ncbi:MAG: hypothetical protein Q9191_008386, partial [Dirinaria sp. TL-2023a]
YLHNLVEKTYKSGDQGVLRFELFQLLDETEQLYIITTYQDQSTKYNHRKTKLYLDTMKAIENRDLATVKLNESRLWTCKNFTRCARLGNEVFECIPCGKKREPWDLRTVDDGREDEEVEGESSGRSSRFANDA